MATLNYISIEELADFHKVKTTVVREFADFGLINIQVIEEKPCVIETDLDRCESAIRLFRDLSVNKEGIEIILEMREKHTALQNELKLLKHKIKKHEELMERMFE